MGRIKIGVLGPANIAIRKMIPAMRKSDVFEYVGVAVASVEEYEQTSTNSSEGSAERYRSSIAKATQIVNDYGGRVFESYEELILSKDLDAVYIPLPPALHFYWAKEVLKSGKSLLMEKPFTLSYSDTQELLNIAEEKGLAVIENYAFAYNSQIYRMQEFVKEGIIGELRLIRSNFGFPYRGSLDFRYAKDMGGGAMYDCGGYVIKALQLFMDESITINCVKLMRNKTSDVDIYGAISAADDHGVLAQVAFSMEQQYSCDLELWGTKGCIKSTRIFTAPADLDIHIMLKTSEGEKKIVLGCEDQFLKCLNLFAKCHSDNGIRNKMYEDIKRQGLLVEKCMNMANRGE